MRTSDRNIPNIEKLYTLIILQGGDQIYGQVELEAREGIAKGIVTQVNVPGEEIAPFKDRAKTIIGKAQIKEEVAAE